METNEKNLTAEESIQIISDMITKTKESISNKSHYFLLWGWLSVIASLGNYFLLKSPFVLNAYYIWFLLPIVGMPLSIYFQKSDPDKAITHVGLFIKHIWTGFSITSLIMFTMIFFINFPILLMFLLLMGTAVFITGSVMKFKALIYGAIFFWMGAISCILIKNSSDQLIVYAFSVIAGYLIPGYILRLKYMNSHV